MTEFQAISFLVKASILKSKYESTLKLGYIARFYNYGIILVNF